MAVGIDMFGTGGEGLGGLFVGNQMAMQRDQAAAEQAKMAADIANTQEITRQRQLGNQYEEAILGDKIGAFREAAQAKRDELTSAKFDAQGEKFGKLGQTMASLPAVARPAALRQMASQAGIGEDNPMLQHFMNMDPEQLPDTMMKYSQGFYDMSNAARTEKQKRDAMLAQKQVELTAKAEEGEATRQMRRDIANQASEDRRFLGQLAASSRQQAAAAKGAKPPNAQKLTTDQAIAASIMNNPDLSDQEKLEALQRHTYNKAVMGKPGTEEQIMGAPSPEARVESAITRGRKGGAGAPTTGGTDIAAAVKKAGQQYEPDKFEYRITPDGRVQKRPK